MEHLPQAQMTNERRKSCIHTRMCGVLMFLRMGGIHQRSKMAMAGKN